MPNRFVYPFGIFGIIWVVLFVIVIVIFIAEAAIALRRWSKNRSSPRLTVEALVAAKRAGVGRNAGTGSFGAADMYSYTKYFATFEFESGDRLELPMSGSEYGMIAEGDKGRLTFQGTKFISFERTFRDSSAAGFIGH